MNLFTLPVRDLQHQVCRYSYTGEEVIFLHFMNGSIPIWNEVAEQLTDQYALTAYDIRGYGRSQYENSEALTLETLVDDLHEIMNQMKIEKAHLVGSSLGAYVALLFACHYPNRTLSLTVSEGAIQPMFGKFGVYENKSIEEIKTLKHKLSKLKEKDFSTLEEWHMHFKSQFKVWNTAKENWMNYAHRFKENGRYAPAANQLTNQVLGDRILELDLYRLYEKVQCPVLFLPAEQERGLDLKLLFIETIREKLKNSRLEVIQNSNHAMMLDNPREFSDTLREFLRPCETD